MNKEGSVIANNNPFLGRILREPYLCTSKDFHVVRDRWPVIDGHYLLFTKSQIPSLADADVDILVEFINGYLIVQLGEEYILIERGRALSCTSFEVVHAHAHLIPVCYSGVINERLRSLRSYKFESLKSALSSIEKGKSYLLWGELRGSVELSYEVKNLPKRFVRSVIEGGIDSRENKGGNK